MELLKATGEKICYSCLEPNHFKKSPLCKFKDRVCGKDGCQEVHHWLLHPGGKVQTNVGVVQGSEADVVSSNTTSLITPGGRRVILGTLEVEVKGPTTSSTALVTIDGGSTATFVSESFAKRSGLKMGSPTKMTVQGIGGKVDKVTTHQVWIIMKSKDSNDEVKILAWTLPVITKRLEIVNWASDKQQYRHLKDLPLPEMKARQQEPDILIGSDNINLHHGHRIVIGQEGEPCAELTALGWIVKGPLKEDKITKRRNKTIQANLSNVRFDMPDLAQRFFESENFGSECPNHAKPDPVWQMIKSGITKLNDGPGYQVLLPWKEELKEFGPGNNFRQAKERLESTLKKVMKKKEDCTDYCKAMDDYVKNGYASFAYDVGPDCEELKEPGQNFLPHHGVRKRSTNRLRIVFDASCKYNNLSMNDRLFIGPRMQIEVHAALNGFRENAIACTADIHAMFSRIRLTEDDAKKHQFLWKEPGDTSDRLSVYRMNRVTFGTGASPCLAMAVTKRAAIDYGEDKPLGADLINRMMYVDDALFSKPGA